ncbi:MAG TPA: 5'-3' exonuclease H3TH domain-containing protein [Acidimicrobiales bacterium]
MYVHLVDGTYELFRYFFALPSHVNADGREVAATRGVLGTCLQLLEEGATHVGVATDHVIESFRNDLLATYKTGEGVDPALKQQFSLLEDVLRAAGFTVWAMVELEADDALASAAVVAAADPRVERALICTPDKDLGQCVTKDGRVVQLDRRKGVLLDHDAVVAKFGVLPGSIPDYLGLVGDTADGIPGIPGWGARSTAAVLARYHHYEQIPPSSGQWDVPGVRGAAKLAKALCDNYDDALLYRRLATLERDAPVGTVDEWRWTGPTPDLDALCKQIDAPNLAARAARIAAARS